MGLQVLGVVSVEVVLAHQGCHGGLQEVGVHGEGEVPGHGPGHLQETESL